jgi:hypothetical protein
MSDKVESAYSSARGIAEDLCESPTVVRVANAVAPTLMSAGVTAITGNPALGLATQVGLQAASAADPKPLAVGFMTAVVGFTAQVLAPILLPIVIIATIFDDKKKP